MAVPGIPVNALDIVVTNIYCQFAEQVSINRLGWLCTATAGLGITLRDVCTSLSALVGPTYKALLANNAMFYGVDARKFIGQKLSLANNDNSVNSGPGTAGADAQGRQVAGMFTKLGNIAGRTGRGRVYVPFPSTTDTDADGVPTAGYMVNLGTLAAQLFAVLNVAGAGTGTLAPQLITYPRPTHTPPIVLSSRAWTAATARQKWATHRSRGSYGRSNPLPF
jgi:hypothetical protein